MVRYGVLTILPPTFFLRTVSLGIFLLLICSLRKLQKLAFICGTHEVSGTVLLSAYFRPLDSKIFLGKSGNTPDSYYQIDKTVTYEGWRWLRYPYLKGWSFNLLSEGCEWSRSLFCFVCCYLVEPQDLFTLCGNFEVRTNAFAISRRHRE
jgi:hypothetical protein